MNEWMQNTAMLRRLNEDSGGSVGYSDDSDATRPFDPDFAPDLDGFGLG